MHLRSGRLVHNLEVIATMDPNSSNVLRDIQEQLQLMRTEMGNMSNQMNNLSGRMESIESLQIRQSSESEHSNDNHRNPQRPVSRRNRHHNQHQGHNDFDDPNDSERSNDYRQRPVHPRNRQYNRNQGHHEYDDPDERVMRHIKVDAPTFEGQLDPWIFDKWIRDMDQFFGWYNLSENRRVRFAKMKLSGTAQLYWESVEESLLRRGQPPITDWVEMKTKLEEKYLPRSYRGNLLDQWNNLR